MRALFALVLIGALGCGDDTGVGANASGGAGGFGASSSGGGGSGQGGDANGGNATGGMGEGGLGAGTPADCAPLDPPDAGTTLDVDASQADDLPQIISTASAGTTIVLAPGTYTLSSIVQVFTDGITIRSANDDAESVIIDGDYVVPELFQVTANDITFAHITLTHAVDHLIHAFPPDPGVDITGLRLYGVRMIDSGEQFLKVNPIVPEDGWVDEGRVECSTFQMTAEGRPHVESCCGGCYTGGIDVHSAQGWVVAKNRFDGIYCDAGGLAEHAVHFWKGARDSLVEDNIITNCARGIGFGLENGAGTRMYPDNPHGGAVLAHYDGIIRNNFIFADVPYFDTGIEVAEASEPHVIHNTVITTPSATGFFSSIDYRFASTSAIIKNNLVQVITQRNEATGDVSNNLSDTPLEYFVDAQNADLHLTDGAANALGQGVPLSDAGLDIDGEAHDAAAPDLGADEH